MEDRIDLPYLRSASITAWANPAWYLFALVAGIIGFAVMLKHIPADIGLSSGVVLFIVLPFGIPVGIVALLTWHTDWQTSEKGLMRSRLLRNRLLRWSEINSARLLNNGKTELISNGKRIVVPSRDAALTASLWQYLRAEKGFGIPESIASIWISPPDDLPEEFTWENPRRISYWSTNGLQILLIIIMLPLIVLFFWQRWKMKDSSPQSSLILAINILNLINCRLISRQYGIAQRIIAGSEGLAIECPGHKLLKVKWENVSNVKFRRNSIVLSSFQEVVIPKATTDANLPVLLAIISKHLRNQPTQRLFIIPPDLRLA